MGKRLAAINHKKREVKKKEEQAQLEKTGMNQYYGIGAIIALGVIGGLGYYIYWSKKGEVPNRESAGPHSVESSSATTPQVQLQTNKFEMD